MKLLFHCCCAPCTVSCVESLSAEGITPVLFWYNPNIHPYTEYQNRRDTLFAFAAAENLTLEKIDEYGLRLFLQNIRRKTEAPERCDVCYRLRLERTAAYAAEHDFDAFSTSLLISPYQQHDLIRRTGEELAVQYGIKFLYRDFRPLFRAGQAKARALGLYMQKFCGCIFSAPKKAPCQAVSLYKKQHSESPDNDQHDQKFQRLALLAGTEILKKLAETTVLVFGAGGVGSWCAEALVRSGVGKIGIIDYDTVCASNVNRQVQATSRTLGLSKVEVLKQRLLEINPQCKVTAWEMIFSRENADTFGIEKADYVIDAIDSLPHKLDLIETSCAAGVKFFSSMGMAWKTDPLHLKTADIWETQGCPLARLVRQGLRKRGFDGNFTVVYSSENPMIAQHESNTAAENTVEKNSGNRKRINGSAVTVTAPAGMVLASLVLRDRMGL